MALDKITSKNFLSKGGPYIHVYSGWYNAMVDVINGIIGSSVMVGDNGIEANDSTHIPNMPLVGAPSDVHIFYEDFVKSAAAAAIEATWTVYETDAGNTQVLIDGAGGILQLTNGAADDDSSSQVVLQQETFRLATGKKLWFETRVRVPEADVTNLDLSIGLIVTEDLTAVADNKPANGIVFIKTDAGVGTIFLNVSDNNVDKVNAASIKTLVTNTWTRLGFYFDGGATGHATITPYIDGVACQAIAGVTYATMSELAPSFKVANGDAVTTQKLDIDYVYVVQER